MGTTNVCSIQKKNKEIKKRCCLNCKNLVQFPRGNSYGDIDYLCIKTGYFVVNVGADVKKIKRYTPGGKELVCCHESSRQKDKKDILKRLNELQQDVQKVSLTDIPRL